MLAEFAATYGITDLSAFPGDTPADVMLEVYTYARFAEPAARLAEARGTALTWTYRFDGLALGDTAASAPAIPPKSRSSSRQRTCPNFGSGSARTHHRP